MEFQLFIVPFLLLTFISSLLNLTLADLNSDRKALLEFSSTLQHTSRLNWNNSTPICTSWIGITCNQNETNVISIHLPGIGLKGTVPNNSSLRKLDSLKILSLHSNELSGNLPSSILSIPSLQYINLQHNNFTGLVPSFISTKLIALDLSFNSFFGAIPVFNLSRLKYLNLSYNNLNGSIPFSINQFPYTSFVGNSLLCGKPLNHCSTISPSSSPSPSTTQNRNATTSKKFFGVASILAFAIGGIAFLSLIVLVIFVCCLKKRRSKRSNDIPKGKAETEDSISKSFGSGVMEAERNKLFFFEGCSYCFDLEDLLKASAEVLGKGSYGGTTYRATLEEGITVVVKRLREVVVGMKEFEQQMEVVGRIGRHSNVIPLRAYYYSKNEKLLVYDYMHGGSLFSSLHGNRGVGRTPLNWNSRMKIALGAAKGIASIHTEGGSKFIHGNIKSTNVLITQEHDGYITDVGLTPLMNTSSGSIMSRSNGYRAPELAAESRRTATQKSDVYSFGVLLLEKLTGKIPLGYSGYDHDMVDLPRWVRSVVREEWTAEVFDEEMIRGGEYVEEEMVQMLQIALACVSKLVDDRPTMDEVVRKIVEIRQPELKKSTSSESEFNV
ncbi:unnamed protein product [Trifolium pratense]|uniref:Uncharacterized protein n=1 Tax=Trifolium pratense TaxID=57577 RepID=A0ACB0K862_TRIPR|nr:unnamed protein product [Trifolium pratense]